MRNEEFDIVRDLMTGRLQRWSPSPYTARDLQPATFREIDGQELARQYVAHRKFRESERLSQQAEASDLDGDRIRLGAPASTVDLAAYDAVEQDGWFSSLARLFRLR